METYVRNSLTDDTAVVKIDSNKLSGRYLEVLWSKMIAQRDLNSRWSATIPVKSLSSAIPQNNSS